jgi:hypothetical protein
MGREEVTRWEMKGECVRVIDKFLVRVEETGREYLKKCMDIFGLFFLSYSNV